MTKRYDIKLLKRFFITVVIFTLTAGVVFGQSPLKSIKIACIGNSITFGARAPHPEKQSYPAVLSMLLQENGYHNCEVKNFGISSATMLHFGTPNLWPVLDSLKNNIPDIVIIKAGTNETVGAPRYNWEHIADFEKDYAEFIRAIRKINPNCQLILCSPIDIALKTKGLSVERLIDLTRRRPRIWQLRKRVSLIAKEHHTFFLDLTKAFKNRTELITEEDGVHPNVEGYRYLAGVVFNFLRSNARLAQYLYQFSIEQRPR